MSPDSWRRRTPPQLGDTPRRQPWAPSALGALRAPVVVEGAVGLHEPHDEPDEEEPAQQQRPQAGGGADRPGLAAALVELPDLVASSGTASRCRRRSRGSARPGRRCRSRCAASSRRGSCSTSTRCRSPGSRSSAGRRCRCCGPGRPGRPPRPRRTWAGAGLAPGAAAAARRRPAAVLRGPVRARGRRTCREG